MFRPRGSPPTPPSAAPPRQLSWRFIGGSVLFCLLFIGGLAVGAIVHRQHDRPAVAAAPSAPVEADTPISLEVPEPTPIEESKPARSSFSSGMIVGGLGKEAPAKDKLAGGVIATKTRDLLVELASVPAGNRLLGPTGTSDGSECQTCGTSVTFVSSPREAAEKARRAQRLVYVLHVSGNFEEPDFT